jgi:septal ring factor EnvC (AmiA/AmiB activator)
MKTSLEIINKLSDKEAVKLDSQESQKVELASTFNQVVDKHKYLEKTINGYLNQFDSIKKWVQGSKQDVETNENDLKRIQNSLKELGFTEESKELAKYLSSNIYKEYNKLYNSTK